MQELFKIEIMKGSNGKSYIRAGYKAPTGEVVYGDALLLGSDSVQTLVQFAMQKARGRWEAQEEAKEPKSGKS